MLLLAKLPVAEKLKFPATFIVPEEEIVPELSTIPVTVKVLIPNAKVPEDNVKLLLILQHAK